LESVVIWEHRRKELCIALRVLEDIGKKQSESDFHSVLSHAVLAFSQQTAARCSVKQINNSIPSLRMLCQTSMASVMAIPR
jgi:hypothetical protein